MINAAGFTQAAKGMCANIPLVAWGYVMRCEYVSDPYFMLTRKGT